MDTPDRGRVLERLVMPEAPIQRLSNQEIFVELTEDLGDSRARHVLGDAERAELAQHAQPAAPFDEGFRSGERHRGPAVIQGAFPTQPGDGGINVVRLEFAARESRADLRFRQLSSCEPS